MKEMKVSEALEMLWLRHGSSLPSHKSYKSMIGNIAAHIGDLMVHEVDAATLRSYRAERMKKARGSTVNREQTIVVTLYTKLAGWMRSGTIPPVRMPLDKFWLDVKRDDERRYQRRVVLTDKEIEIIMESAAGYPDVRRVAHFALTMGRRKEEIDHLRKDDFDPASQRITGYQSKTGRFYTVPVPDDVAPYFKEAPTSRVFSYELRNWRRKFEHVRKVAVENGCRWFVFKDFRRTAAMRLYEICKDIVAVQNFLGHASIQTTMKYLNIEPAGLREAMNRMAGSVKIQPMKEVALP